jgi:hypothetical protein
MKLAVYPFALFWVALASPVFAQSIIVGWGGNSVSASTSLNGFTSQSIATNVNVDPLSRQNRLLVTTDALSDDSIVGIPFSMTTQLSPTSGYTGQRFYGGVSASVLNSQTPNTIDRIQISNQGPNDILDFRYALNSTQHDSRVAIYFDKADFLAGGATNAVQIGPNSTASIRFNSNTSNQVNNDGEMRWIVREAGQWWISAKNAAGQPNIRAQDDETGAGIKNQTTYSSLAGELAYWAPFDPVTGGGLTGLNFEPAYDSRFVITPGTNPFALKSFADITAFGFYIEGDQFSTNVFQFEVDSITISALVVPEPGAYALMCVFGLGAVALRYIRQPKKAEAAKTEEPAKDEPQPVQADVMLA